MSPFVAPNLYQLAGHGLHVSYTTTGFDGKPHFTYQDAHGAHSFAGDEITSTPTPIGTLVTVRLRLTIDAGSTTFSVLLPTVNLTDGVGHSAPIHTDGITTVHRFSVVPALNSGQTELYTFTALNGTASLVVF